MIYLRTCIVANVRAGILTGQFSSQIHSVVTKYDWRQRTVDFLTASDKPDGIYPSWSYNSDILFFNLGKPRSLF